MLATSTGKVLGASTAIGTGLTVLPSAGLNTLGFALAIFSASIGVIVLASFVGTRILKLIL